MNILFPELGWNRSLFSELAWNISELRNGFLVTSCAFHFGVPLEFSYLCACLFTHGFAGSARLCFLFPAAKLCFPWFVHKNTFSYFEIFISHFDQKRSGGVLLAVTDTLWHSKHHDPGDLQS
jgi:hypothetical protein